MRMWDHCLFVYCRKAPESSEVGNTILPKSSPVILLVCNGQFTSLQGKKTICSWNFTPTGFD